jgi:serine/threonine protein kinase
MGAIYEAVHCQTGRHLALKTLLPGSTCDADLRARFQLEARIMAEVESEHLVEVVDAGEDAETGLPFLVMELLRGEDLGTLLDTRGPLAYSDVVLLLHQAALVLDKTHQAGVLHRDLKPENLFVTTRDDGSLRVKLLDFGIAKVIQERTGARTTRNLGTPLYMSPEQLRGDGNIGPRADLFSLGHVAFTVLTGHAYWQPEAASSRNHHTLLLRLLEGTGQPACERARSRGIELPSSLDGWFARATALAPSRRFASAMELVSDLARVLEVELPRPRLPSFALSKSNASESEPRHLPNTGPRSEPPVAGSVGELPASRRSGRSDRSSRLAVKQQSGLSPATLALGAAVPTLIAAGLGWLWLGSKSEPQAPTESPEDPRANAALDRSRAPDARTIDPPAPSNPKALLRGAMTQTAGGGGWPATPAAAEPALGFARAAGHGPHLSPAGSRAGASLVSRAVGRPGLDHPAAVPRPVASSPAVQDPTDIRDPTDER